MVNKVDCRETIKGCIASPMPRLLVHGFTISLDGYGAGPDQTLEVPSELTPARVKDAAGYRRSR